MRCRWNAAVLVVLLGAAGCAGGQVTGPDGGLLDGGALVDASTDAGPGPDASDAGAFPPARPIGVNLPDLLWNYLGQGSGDAAAAKLAMQTTVDKGFTFARFVATPFYPKGMTTGNGWIANPTAYFAAFDALVSDARALGLRLVPSLLWNTFLFPDLAGEPIGNLFTPGTGARKLAESYVTAVVSRYASSPAIQFWELTNEFNLDADIDFSTCDVCNGATASCGTMTVPSQGEPCKRTVADNFFSCNACRGVSSTQQDLGQFTESMAALIHGLDAAHPVSTGFAYPRPSAYHLSHSPCPSCDWTANSVAQYQSALANLSPKDVDLVSVHHYPGKDLERFGDTDPAGLALLATTETAVEGLGKKLYVGEFGESRAGSVTCGASTTACGGDPTRADSQAVLNGLVASHVPWASLWALDFYQFCPSVPSCGTVTDDEEIVGSMLAHADAYGACSGASDGTSCPIGACVGQECAPEPVGAQTASDVASWTSWTNCSGCAPSTFVPVSGAVRLTANDLPCTGTCQFPGAYAVSPKFAAKPGHLLVRFSASASAAGPVLHAIALDASSSELASVATPANVGGMETETSWLALPAATASVEVRLEDSTPYSTVDLGSVTLAWEP